MKTSSMKSQVFAFAAGAGTVLFLLFTVVIVASAPQRAGGSYALSPGTMEVDGRFQDMPHPAPSMAPPPEPERQREERRSSGKLKKAEGYFGNGRGLGALGLKGSGAGGGGTGMAIGGNARTDELDRDEGKPDLSGEAAGSPSRSWFPESFLFEPLVVTNDQGEAFITTRVPDRLTHWRILALAHARNGSQAGTVTGFQGTLPAYVEPVVPTFLYSGDEVKLPIRVVNTTAATLSEPFAVSVAGGRIVSTTASRIDVPAEGSRTERVSVAADRAGKLVLNARIGATDAVERAVTIHPRGTRIVTTFGGTLAAPRTAALSLPTDATADGTRVRLTVYPGALALLRSELTAASSRGSSSAELYALLLAGRAPELLRALGEEADPEAIRQLTLISSQQAFVTARSVDPLQAASLAEAAAAHAAYPMLARLAERMASKAASGQRPDGTFGGGSGWTLQRVLAATADGVLALSATASIGEGAAAVIAKNRVQLAKLKAAGAFERNLARMISEEGDGYTAALALASGAVSGTVAEALREKVRASIEILADGSRVLRVPAGIVRADGAFPSAVEATAAAILALEGDPKAPWIADLGAALLSGYQPARGWGDGRANTVCLRAALALFKEKLPETITVTLLEGDVVLARGTLDAIARKSPFVLDTLLEHGATARSLTIRAEPPLAGLGYSLATESWTKDGPAIRAEGLEVAVKAPTTLRVGRSETVEVTAVAPSSSAGFSIRTALPAGVQPDTRSLEQLVERQLLVRFETEPGFVTLHAPPLAPGRTFSASFNIVPTLAGKLHVPPTGLSWNERLVATTAASRWTVE